jgi:hypothetical protein
MTNRQHDIVILLVIFLLAALAGLVTGIGRKYGSASDRQDQYLRQEQQAMKTNTSVASKPQSYRG